MDNILGPVQGDPGIHKTLFGEDFEQTRTMLKELDAPFGDEDNSWERTDYQEAIRVLERLYKVSSDEFDWFIDDLKELDGLHFLDFRTRCRFIYYLIFNYTDPETTKMGVIHCTTYDLPIVQEKMSADGPRIDIDFQKTLNAIRALTRAEDKLGLWLKMLGEALEG